ncbi:ABC-three component system middle component 8 [Brevibacillus invocatus]|uniref:ABC-three component system middle component 8 n=1 Tax=Brevibacillus invocatus TaxID=173959 RepID=UPI003B8A7C47
MYEIDSCNYNELYKTVEEHLGEDAFYLFLPSLNFLFLLGKLKYDIGSDMLEMII